MAHRSRMIEPVRIGQDVAADSRGDLGERAPLARHRFIEALRERALVVGRGHWRRAIATRREILGDECNYESRRLGLAVSLELGARVHWLGILHRDSVPHAQRFCRIRNALMVLYPTDREGLTLTAFIRIHA